MSNTYLKAFHTNMVQLNQNYIANSFMIHLINSIFNLLKNM